MGAYNLTPYNRRELQSKYETRYTYFATLTGTMSPVVRYEPAYNFAAQVEADVILRHGFLQTWDIYQPVSGDVELQGLLTPPYAMSASITGDVRVFIFVGPKMDVQAAVNGKANATIAVSPKQSVSATVDGYMDITIAITPDYDGFVQFMDGVVSVEHLIEERAYLQLTVQPGQTVVINSDIYTVYLGTKNVLDSYTGEFLRLNRDADSLEVSGGLDVRLLYTEAYL